MQRIERILVPTDFSLGSRRAVEFTCGVARGLGANITLLHVLHLPTKEYGDAVYATVVDRKSSVLRSCEAALQPIPVLTLRGVGESDEDQAVA